VTDSIFFEERTRYPRFKRYGAYRNITYPQITQENIGRNSILLPKIGRVRIVKHRSLKGKPKTLTLVHSKSGEWIARKSSPRMLLLDNELSTRSEFGRRRTRLSRCSFFSDEYPYDSLVAECFLYFLRVKSLDVLCLDAIGIPQEYEPEPAHKSPLGFCRDQRPRDIRLLREFSP
jgi:hypothetical protein